MKSKSRVVTFVLICVLILAYSIFSAKFKPIIPNDEFAFSPTPENGQAGGIEGVYYRKASSPIEIMDELSCKTEGYDNCIGYDILRFYNDGAMLDVSFASDNIKDDWQYILEWFHRDTEVELSRGLFFTSGNHIWFRATATYSFDNNRIVTIDYSGTVLGNTLILDVYSHYNGRKQTLIYNKADVDD